MFISLFKSARVKLVKDLALPRLIGGFDELDILVDWENLWCALNRLRNFFLELQCPV